MAHDDGALGRAQRGATRAARPRADAGARARCPACGRDRPDARVPLGRRRAVPRARPVPALLRRGARRHGYGHAAHAGRDRGDLEGLRHLGPDPGGAGTRLAGARARGYLGAEGALPPAPREWRVAVRVRADRGGLGLGRGRDADDGAARRRRVRARRDEAIHHERGRGRAVHRVREDRRRCRASGNLGVPRRGRDARLLRDAARAEARDPRFDDRRAALRRRAPAAAGAPGRAGIGLQAGDADPRPLAPGSRGTGARPTTRSSTRGRARRWASRSPSTS
jgi:hypothetical protein